MRYAMPISTRLPRLSLPEIKQSVFVFYTCCSTRNHKLPVGILQGHEEQVHSTKYDDCILHGSDCTNTV